MNPRSPRLSLAAAFAAALAWSPAGAVLPDESFEKPLVELAASVRTAAPAASAPPSAPGREVDVLGRPVGPATRLEYEALLGSIQGRMVSPAEKDLLLALTNLPEVPSGPFRDRKALVRHFAKTGVGLRASGSGLADTDIWRLIRAARAASEAFRIPPGVLLCLTFRESGFNSRASAWTTSAKGVAQLTNGAVSDTVAQIRRHPDLGQAAARYVELLRASHNRPADIRMPDKLFGAPDVDALNADIQRLQKEKAPPEAIKKKKLEKQAAIQSHKDEPGHIFNLETNFGLGAAYLAYLRVHRLKEVPDDVKGWLTAVGAYNQGIGFANDLIYDVFQGPDGYARASLDEIFNPAAISRLALSPERQHEMLGEVGSVRSCALP